MPCFYPIKTYYIADRKGKKLGVTFYPKKNEDTTAEFTVPCGKCDGCRLERSRQWAVRCMHEASLHEQNVFVTLTYNEDNLPSFGELYYRDFQLFMKRLRFKYTGKKIRFFMCGEYGETGKRPHYHALIFGLDFPDKVLFKKTSAGYNIYTSEVLNKLWINEKGESIGFASIGDVTFESAGYVARYVLKKRQQKLTLEDCTVVDLETGEARPREEEFCRMSLRDGIGYGFYRKWLSDIFPDDHVVVKGKEMKPPRFYLKKLQKEFPDIYEEVMQERMMGLAERKDKDMSEEKGKRLETIYKSKIRLLKRELA